MKLSQPGEVILRDAWDAWARSDRTDSTAWPQTTKFLASFHEWMQTRLHPERGGGTVKHIELDLEDGLHVPTNVLLSVHRFVGRGSPVSAELARRLEGPGSGRLPRDFQGELQRSKPLGAFVVLWDFLRTQNVKDARGQAFETVAEVSGQSARTLEYWWSERPYKPHS